MGEDGPTAGWMTSLHRPCPFSPQVEWQSARRRHEPVPPTACPLKAQVELVSTLRSRIIAEATAALPKASKPKGLPEGKPAGHGRALGATASKASRRRRRRRPRTRRLGAVAGSGARLEAEMDAQARVAARAKDEAQQVSQARVAPARRDGSCSRRRRRKLRS